MEKVDRDDGEYTKACRHTLGESTKAKIHRCMISALSSAELIWGNETDEYDRFRKAIFKSFNANKRYVDKELDKYNVKKITSTITFTNRVEEGKEE